MKDNNYLGELLRMNKILAPSRGGGARNFPTEGLELPIGGGTKKTKK